MMEKRPTRRDTFIVRIWREEGQPGWTGRVQHIGTGEVVLVRSLDKLLTFVERQTGKLTGPVRKGLK
jgi:hypothetical protein